MTVYQINKGRLFPRDLLYAIESVFAFFRIETRCLSAHEAVDFRFPQRFWLLLAWVPLVIFRGTQPDVHLCVRSQAHIGEAQQARFIVEGASDALNQGRK